MVSEAADSTTQQLLETKVPYSNTGAFQGQLCLRWGVPAGKEPLALGQLLSYLAIFKQPRSTCARLEKIWNKVRFNESLSSLLGKLRMLERDVQNGIVVIFSKQGECQQRANKLHFMNASTGNKFTSPQGVSCDWLVLLYLAAFFDLVCECWQGVSRQYIRRVTSLLLNFYS